MNALWITLAVVAVIIIVVLAVIAFRLTRKVKEVQKKREEQLAELEKQKQEHHQYVHNSIQVLAQGVIDDQLTLTEAAIRISVLLENLPEKESHREDYSSLYQLAEATSHIPILDAWKDLSTKEKLRFDNERVDIEEKYRDFVVSSCQKLRKELQAP